MHGINVYQCQCHHPTHWCPFEFVSGRFNRDTRDAGLADYGLNMRSWGRNLATPNSFPWVGVIQDLKVIWRVVTCWEMRLCSRSRSVEGFHLLTSAFGLERVKSQGCIHVTLDHVLHIQELLLAFCHCAVCLFHERRLSPQNTGHLTAIPHRIGPCILQGPQLTCSLVFFASVCH